MEDRVNNWLDKTIANNNGVVMIYDGYEIIESKNFMFCNQIFSKIIDYLKSNKLELYDDDEFRDMLTYIIYKYSHHE